MFEAEYPAKIFAVLIILTLFVSVTSSLGTLSMTGAFELGDLLDFNKLFDFSRWFAPQPTATEPVITDTTPSTTITPTTTPTTGILPRGFTPTPTASLSICDGRVSASQYVVGYDPTYAIIPNDPTGYTTGKEGVTLTPTEFGDALSKGTISAYVLGSVKTYEVKEELMLSDLNYIKYDENGPNPSGHGLYYYAPYSNIKYRLDFSGLPTNRSAYNEVPEITMIGETYAIDALELESGRLVLYSGSKVELTEEESITVGTTTVTLVAIGQTTTSAGTTFVAHIKVEKGTSTESKDFLRLSGYDFLASLGAGNSVPVYIEEVVYGAVGRGGVVLRVGGRMVKFTQGQQFPLDSRWNVQSIDITANSPDNGLRAAVLRYGNPTGATSFDRGTFDATVAGGLETERGVIGPKNSAGKVTWNMTSLGYCPIIDSTGITFKGVGLASSSTSTIQVTWTDRDGIKNELTPADRSYVNIQKGNDIDLVLGTLPYTVVNDKAIWFSQIKQVTSGTNTQYTPVFRLGGSNGFTISGSTVTSNFTPSSSNPLSSKISYTGPSGNKLECEVLITGLNTVTIKNPDSSGYSTICDTIPNFVQVGPESTFGTTGAPTLGLMHVGSRNPIGDNYMVTVDGNKRPFAQVGEGGTGLFNVWFDDTTTPSGGDSGTTTGLKAHYSDTMGGDPSGNVDLTHEYIDQSRTTTYEPHLYHIAEAGSVLDGSVSNTIKATLYDGTPTSIVVFNGGLVAAPPSSSPQIAFSIESCNGYSVTVRNIGDITLSENADIYDSSGRKVGYLNFGRTNIAPGGVATVSIYNNNNVQLTQSSAIAGTFTIDDPDYPVYAFQCGSATQTSFTIDSCNGYSAVISNTGDTRLTANADIYDSNDQKVGYLNFGRTGVPVGASRTVAIYDSNNFQLNQFSAITGTFNITDPDYPAYTFVCSYTAPDTQNPSIVSASISPSSAAVADSLTFRVSASDNVALKRVRFIIDKQTYSDCTISTSSSSCSTSGTNTRPTCTVSNEGKSAVCTAYMQMPGRSMTYYATAFDTSNRFESSTEKTVYLIPLSAYYTPLPPTAGRGKITAVASSPVYAINIYKDGVKQVGTRFGISNTYSCVDYSSNLNSCDWFMFDQSRSTHTFYAESFTAGGVKQARYPLTGTLTYVVP
jgi:hypothetical protein